MSRAERKRFQQPRHRREHSGELVQIDGSEHRWFEDRAAACTLLVFVDDATSRLMELRFVASESTFAYFEALKAYLRRHGKPVALYSDKHSIFRVSNENAASGNGMTQFGRALSELNIEILCANTSQAKGRVERAHHTLQDRLVKELRLAGISTIEAANAFLPSFVANYNGRFAKPAARDQDFHRSVDPRQDLDQILCWRELRQVSHQLVVTFRMGDWRFAGKAGRCLTRPSTSCSASVMPPLSRTSAWARSWPGSRNSKTASPVSTEFQMDRDDRARSRAF